MRKKGVETREEQKKSALIWIVEPRGTRNERQMERGIQKGPKLTTPFCVFSNSQCPVRYACP
ncbi:hypothetical protein DCAR_0624675 [Daucus carota subsp. sativus]|uniref:Uncharacterized protein n=1 Tax=Daucus carota subsp. sativus TaxID=79200 RepID=A0A164VZ98_DAUCS|nr:hypothetical protein DCAR_0624675 [Daucus carota subsp. sativus]